MKCSNCWSRRIDTGDANILHKTLAAAFLMTPVKCRHCFHCFHIPIWTNLAASQNQPSPKASSEEDVESEILPFAQEKEVAVSSEQESESTSIRKAA